MRATFLQLAAVGLSVFALLCWLVIFLAGTDVWHDVGSPNVWSLQTSPYPDLRACLYAFYLLFIVLVGSVILTVLTFTRARRVASKGV